MKTIRQYTVYTNSEKSNNELLNKKAIEEGHTDSGDIYSKDFDCSWTDSQGRIVTSGHRLTKDRKNKVLITVINSYEADKKTKEQKELIINND
jgi:hypothetical protein